MTTASLPFATLLDAVAAKTPAPGGGAVACASAALAAALAQMVVNYSINKKSLAEHKPALEAADRALTNARRILLELAEEDARAYGLVNELMKLPDTDARRQREWPAAVAASIQVPMAAIATCADLLRLMADLAPMTNTMLHSDLGIAAVLAEASARASRWNVEVNAASLPEPERQTPLTQADAMLSPLPALCRRIEDACKH